jgi:hypothetical protein
MKLYSLILLLGICSQTSGQDADESDTTGFYAKKPGIHLLKSISKSDIAGTFIWYWSKWDYTKITFLLDGHFIQRSWLSCAYDRFDDSGSWKITDPKTIELSSAKQNLRFNLLRSQGATFLIPYSKAQQFIYMALMAQAVKRGEIMNLDEEEYYLFRYEGGNWKKLFYRKTGE